MSALPHPRLRRLRLGVLAASVGLALPAMAQDATPDAPELDAITVTAYHDPAIGALLQGFQPLFCRPRSFPQGLARFGIEAAKYPLVLMATTESVEGTIMDDRCRPMG